MGQILTGLVWLVLLAALLGLSYLFIALGVWLVSFSGWFTFSWGLAFVVWLVLSGVKILFKAVAE